MMNDFLNRLNRPGLRWILPPFISLMYLLKGAGRVPVHYHPRFRAWEFRVKNIVYLSAGPGWAYSFGYLRDLLTTSYYRYYQPHPGDCIIDIGAGLGEETMIFAQDVGPGGAVFSIEANPVTFKALNYACTENHFRHVKVVNLAIVAEEGIAEIEDNPDSYVGNTVGRSDRGNGRLEVKAVSLDMFVRENNITRIDLLKSNIEGAEQLLIQGMPDALSMIRVAAISCHDFRHVHNGESEFYVTKEKVIAFFKANGFEVHTENTGKVTDNDIVHAVNKKLQRA